MLNAIRSYSRSFLGVDPLGDLQPVDWLVMSEQQLRMFTGGRVFHDGPGELTRARAALAYYPQDVWLRLLAAQWGRIGREEAFLGRAGEVGDELGSRLLGARLVRDVMQLAFLLERTYAPYSKWFGTAFARLNCSSALGVHLERTLGAPDWHARQNHLGRAYEQVATMHNALGVTEPVSETTVSFHGRPFVVIHAERFASATKRAITSDLIRNLPPRVDAVNALADASDTLVRDNLLVRLRAFYDSA